MNMYGDASIQAKMIRDKWAAEDSNKKSYGDKYMHVYLSPSGVIGVKSNWKPRPKHKTTYVVYEWHEGQFTMPVFPEISPNTLCSNNFIYVGKIRNPPIL